MLRLILYMVIALILAGIVIAPWWPSPVEQADAKLDAIARAADEIGKRAPLPESMLKARDQVSALMAHPQTAGGQFSVNPNDVFEAVRLIHNAESDLTARSEALVSASTEIATRSTALKTSLPASDWAERLKSVLEATRSLAAAFVWPAFGAWFLYIVLTPEGKEHLKDVAGFIKTLKVGVFELDTWGAAASENQEAVMQKFRKSVQEDFDKLATAKQITETVKRILLEKVEPEIKNLHDGNLIGYRATIHIEDVLLKHSFYQLIDYLPSGGDRGRAFSTRFGMVGRCWRREAGDCLDDVPGGQGLVDKWGMTKEEADRPVRRRTMLCAALRDKASNLVGIFYLDAPKNNDLGNNDQMNSLAKLIETEAENYGLTAALESINQAVSMKKAEALELHGKSA